jgi:PAS domain S-box-containing protein
MATSDKQKLEVGASGEIPGQTRRLAANTEKQARPAEFPQQENVGSGHFVNVVPDIHELRQFAEHAPAAIAMLDTEMRYVAASDRWLSDFGLTGQTLLGRSHYEVFPEIPERWKAIHQRCLAGAVERCDEDCFQRPDGRLQWVRWEIRPWYLSSGEIGGIVLFSEDITERKQAGAALKASEERIARLNRAQDILAAVDHAIVHFQQQQPLLDEICRVAVKKGGFKLAWIGMAAPDGSVLPQAQAGEVAYLKGIRVVTQDVPEGRGPVGTAIRENRFVIVDDVDFDPRMAPWRERAVSFGLHWVAAFPISISGKTAGSFQLYAPRAGFFDKDEVKLLTQVSDDISFALTAIDAIAERRRAEQELRQSEQELADFFSESPLGLLWVAPEGNILRVNQAELELLGRASDEVLGRQIAEFHVEPEVALDVLERVARKETVQNHRARVRDKNGTIKHVLIDANGLWEKDNLVHSRWFVRDTTHRVELEREILTISEREQRRLGHDLHDDLCQQLAGIQFLSESLAHELAAKSSTEAPQAKEIAQSVQHAMTQTRELARGLSPVGMEAEGLMEGLGQLAARTSKLFRLNCRFHCPVPVLVPDHAVAIHLYRIAQEAVGNAVKHAKADRIELALAAAGTSVRLGVSDDGIGIPRKLPRREGMGLRIMRYRAGVIGGSLLIQHRLDGGTGVVCTVTDGLLPSDKRSAR